MKKIGMLILAAGILFSPCSLYAQKVVLGNLNNDLAPVQSAQPDSLVQIAADALNLQPVTSVPQLSGPFCYWVVVPGGINGVTFLPYPCPPLGQNLPIWSIVPGSQQFLLDGTGGQVLPAFLQAGGANSSAMMASAVDLEGNYLLNFIAQIQNSQTPTSQAMAMTMSAMDSGLSGPPGFGDASTNSYSPDGLTNSYTPPDYGTNLWIAQTAVASGYLNGIGSNTVADIVYTVQSVTNLLQAANGWQYEGTIVGSEQTNWTPLSVLQNGRTNLFIRLRSELSSDGSGIPDWWEELYGLTNANGNALDTAGDGYTIYQKYQMGANPNTWVTPAAPQGFSLLYNASNDTATLSWLPSGGNVTGYTISLLLPNEWVIFGCFNKSA